MTDLAAYDMTPVGQRLRALRLAADFRERQALLAAVESQELTQALITAANSPSPAPNASFSPNGLPYSGVTPIAPEPKSLAEEEWAVNRAGLSAGGGGAASPLSGRHATPLRSARPAASGIAANRAARSAVEKKAALAGGSQVAVVKLASYGSGSVRAASLLNYQSDKGKLPLEREDGTFVTGQAAVTALASHWREEDEREPTKDVFRLAIEFDGHLTRQATQAALESALGGHPFAWRIETGSDTTTIHLVAVAAGKGRDEYGKLERYYANEKSIERLQDKIEDAFGRDAEFGEPVWSHGVDGALTALAILTNAGLMDAETHTGESVRQAADRLWAKKPSNAHRPRPTNFNANLQLAKSWQPALRSSTQRDFAHVILSAKPGTDKEAFMDAARATLAKEFAGHEYTFVMHTNRQHIHVHAAIRLISPTGEKLHPGIQDFNRWRETLAEEAREREIPMEAVRRFDQAHAPGYRLKDIKMIERGIAPESVRRRVERVKNKEIFRPTREEGRERANQAALQWKSLSERQVALPHVPDGAMRLYRGEALNDGPHRTILFTTERQNAESYLTKAAHARLLYIDVPAERLSELKPSRQDPSRLFVVPQSLSPLIKAVNPLENAAILPFQRRTEAALAPLPKAKHREDGPMRTAETMESAKKAIEADLAEIIKLIPDGEVKESFEARSQSLLEKANAAIRQQAMLEKTPGRIEGDRYVEPEAEESLGALFTHQRHGSQIHYSRHDPKTGAYQTLAFIDQGKQLDVRDWNNHESVNAALKLATEKWDTITVNGSEAYKEVVVRLAAEHGYQITNLELQDRIREARLEIEANRQAPPKTERDLPLVGDFFEEWRSKTPRKDEEAPKHRDGEALKPTGADPILNTTEAERSIHLQSIRERVDETAQRETAEAARAKAAGETNAAEGSEQTPYRDPTEARAAREAQLSVDTNKERPIPADPNQSQELQQLRAEQQRVFTQEELAQRQADLDAIARYREEQSRPRNEEESEGESP